MSITKFEVEKFNGRINFALWQVQVKDLLIQSGLYKVLKGKPVHLTSGKDPKASGDSSGGSGKSMMSDEEWEELDMKAASQIRLCLAKNVLANVVGLSTTREIWDKLEELYQTKSVSNRLYLKEQFYKLQMEEGTKISDHLSILNGIISELETLGVKIDDEDKALRLILSLPPSYKHMQPILMYGKDTIVFSEVASKLISEERRIIEESRPSENSVLAVCERGKKKNSVNKIVCWKCGQTGHLKKNCRKGGAGSASSSKEEGDVANIVSLEKGDDEFY